MPKSTTETADNGEIPQVSRAASPTAAEKDILVLTLFIFKTKNFIDFKEIVPNR